MLCLGGFEGAMRFGIILEQTSIEITVTGSGKVELEAHIERVCPGYWAESVMIPFLPQEYTRLES